MRTLEALLSTEAASFDGAAAHTGSVTSGALDQAAMDQGPRSPSVGVRAGAEVPRTMTARVAGLGTYSPRATRGNKSP
jgi:hypothetical protein